MTSLRLLTPAVLLISGWFLATGAADLVDEAQPATPAETDIVRETETAMLMALQREEPERALTILEGARARGLPMAQYHLLRAKRAAILRNSDEEEQQLRGAINRDPTLSEAYLRLGGIMERRGLWLDAADLYRRAIEGRPEEVQPHLELARVMLDHGRHKSGIETLQEARRIAPENGHVWIRLAAANERVGNITVARHEYRQAARMTTGSLRRTALGKAADLSLQQGDHPVAFSYYRTAVQEGAAVTGTLYASLGTAADETLWQGIRPRWTVFEEYLEDRTAHPREEVHGVVTEALEGARDLTAFMDGVTAPESLASEHVQRRLLNGLVREALISAITYLDTGDEGLRDNSRERWAEAVSALEDLRETAAGRAGAAG